MQLILGVTDKTCYIGVLRSLGNQYNVGTLSWFSLGTTTMAINNHPLTQRRLQFIAKVSPTKFVQTGPEVNAERLDYILLSQFDSNSDG